LFRELILGLNQSGFAVVTFDLGGIGDSTSTALGDSTQRVKQEYLWVLDALNQLEGVPKTHVILGLCTGADNAHKVSRLDERCLGILLMDGYAFPSHGFKRRKMQQWLAQPKNWLKLFVKIIELPMRALSSKFSQSAIDNPSVPATDDGLFVWHLPDKTQTEQAWKQMLDQGQRLGFIYSGGAYQYVNGATQLFEASPFLKDYQSQIQVQMNPMADHLYTLSCQRTVLFSQVLKWLQQFNK
jgi:hypothetical protein